MADWRLKGSTSLSRKVFLEAVAAEKSCPTLHTHTPPDTHTQYPPMPLSVRQWITAGLLPDCNPTRWVEVKDAEGNRRMLCQEGTKPESLKIHFQFWVTDPCHTRQLIYRKQVPWVEGKTCDGSETGLWFHYFPPENLTEKETQLPSQAPTDQWGCYVLPLQHWHQRKHQRALIGILQVTQRSLVTEMIGIPQLHEIATFNSSFHYSTE